MMAVLVNSRRGAVVYAMFLAVLAWFLYFYHISATGLIGPDEPRYAQVAREMFRSGDYIMPTLLGKPWLEKPPLYYWITAACFRILGVNETAARLPAALFGVGFLGLFAWQTRRLFPGETVRYSVPVLLTSVGWIIYGHAASMEMLFSSLLAGALGFMALWVWQGRRRWLFAFHGMLALSVLAKGFGGIVLAALILGLYCALTREFRWLLHVLNPWALTLFAIIAMPWMGAMYFKLGNVFIQEFIVKHHIKRFLTSELAHPGPWWYYLPILLAGLFPWSAHLGLLRFRDLARDHRRLFLMCWVVVVLAFFSASQGKLPGYILPALPGLAMWMGEEWKRASLVRLRAIAAAQAVLLLVVAGLAGAVPAAMSRGVTHIKPQMASVSLSAGAAVVVLVWLAWRGRRFGATLLAACLTAAMLVSLLDNVAPKIDRTVSARSLAPSVCSKRFGIDQVSRQLRYGLEYYCDRAMVESVQMDYTLGANPPVGAKVVQLFPDAGLVLWKTTPVSDVFDD